MNIEIMDAGIDIECNSIEVLSSELIEFYCVTKA